LKRLCEFYSGEDTVNRASGPSTNLGRQNCIMTSFAIFVFFRDE